MACKHFTLITLIVVILVIPAVVLADGLESAQEYGGYYVVYEKGTEKEIFATSWQVTVGDKYLSSDNRMYRVVEVDAEQKKAYAEFVEKVKLPEVDEILVQETLQTAQANRRIGLYCSHSDESYVPTDGTHSKPGRGGIFEVSEAFKEALEEKGIEVVLDKTSHDPHDANAYVRSRRTATKLLKKRLDAIFDIHRDAIPKKYYLDKINGTPVAKVRIVLGRRNQNLKANEELAFKIKAVADKMYPGFTRDIYYARGNYNQDLAPRALLFELGTHEHTRERAENSTRILADIVAKALYGGSTPQGERIRAEQSQSSGAGSGITWIIVLAVLGSLAYLFLSSGGKEWRSRVKQFTRKEFGSFLARRKRGKE